MSASAHSVIQRLMEVRQAWRLSVDHVATRIGCSTEILRKYELGNGYPSFKFLIKWADVLGYDVSLWPKNK